MFLNYLKKDLYLFYVRSYTFYSSLVFILGACTFSFFLYPKKMEFSIHLLTQDFMLIFFFVSIFISIKSMAWEQQNCNFRMIHFHNLSYMYYYILKVITHFIFLFNIILFMYIVFILFFNINANDLLTLKKNFMIFFILNCILIFSVSSLSTICSSIAIFSKNTYMMYFILFIPLAIPTFTLIIHYINEIFASQDFALSIPIGMSCIYFAVGILIYDYILEE